MTELDRDNDTTMPDEAASPEGREHDTRARPARRSGSRGVFAIAGLVIVALIAGGAYASWRSSYAKPLVDVAPGKPVTVVVPKGANTEQIGQLLAEQGVVPNAKAFRSEVRKADAGGRLRAGTYELRTGMDYEAVITSLTAGPVVVYTTVTIPEGWRLEQVAARMEKQAGIPAKEFMALAEGGAAGFSADHPYLASAYRQSLEGYLFPKTYRIRAGAGARDVIEMMLDQFDKEIASVDVASAASKGVSLPELVTMASIIERETKVPRERPVVSSVIYNRLAEDMRLDMCSTVEYVIKQHKLRLTYADLNVESPYNTYRHAGLPPGPIASPGLASLKAAAAPADTQYLYYVLTGKDGSHTFARTSDEFARAKAKSKEVFGE